MIAEYNFYTLYSEVTGFDISSSVPYNDTLQIFAFLSHSRPMGRQHCIVVLAVAGMDEGCMRDHSNNINAVHSIIMMM